MTSAITIGRRAVLVACVLAASLTLAQSRRESVISAVDAVNMSQAEAEYPGWLNRLLTDPVQGLENYAELFKKLTNPNGSIKVFCEVAEL